MYWLVRGLLHLLYRFPLHGRAWVNFCFDMSISGRVVEKMLRQKLERSDNS